MADLKLKAIIEVNDEAARKSLADIRSKVDTLSTTTEASSQKQTQSWSRVGVVMAGVAAIAGNIFSAMINASPSLGSALTEIGFLFEMVAYVLGEGVAPAFESIIPPISAMVDWFIALDPSIHAVTGGLVAATTAGAGTVGVLELLGVSVAGLLGPFSILVVAIAGLALAWQSNFGGIRDVTADVIGFISQRFAEFAAEHGEQIGRIIGQFQELWAAVRPILEPIAELVWNVLGNTIKEVIDFAVDAFGFFMDFLEGFLDFILGIFDLFTGKGTDRLVSGVTAMLKAAISALVNVLDFVLIAPLRMLFNSLREWDILPAGIREKIPVLPDLNDLLKFHQGGVVPGTGEIPILAKGGEEVLTRSDPRHRDNMWSARPVNITVNVYATGGTGELRNAVRDGVRQGIRGIGRYTEGGYSL